MFENLEVHFHYKIDGKCHHAVFNESFSNDNFHAKVLREKDTQVEKLRISIVPTEEIQIIELYIRANFIFHENDRIFANGYQSWTDSREFFVHEKMHGITKFATPVMKKYQFDKYGDYLFKNYTNREGEFHGYTYSYIRRGDQFELIGSLSERSGYTIIEEHAGKNQILIRKECEGHCFKKEYLPFELVWTKGSGDEVFDTYFSLMNIQPPRCKPMTGWTSWYNYYQNINEEIIQENLNHFYALNKKIQIFQIDDGYQKAIGDWLLVDERKFPHGMKKLAENIKAKGYKAGIWLAPFVCETNSKIFNEKQQWILKDKNNEYVLAGSNWSGFYALDIYNDEVRQYIKEVFVTVLEDWGYDMVKLDFLYAVCLVPRKDKTRGQIMTEAMDFLRECVGDKLILGCGVPLGPAFGRVDYCRIGCDVGLDWDDKPFMRLLHRERISTVNAIKSTIGRFHLDGRAFLNDPDVFLLRDDEMILSDTQKETLATVNKIFGSVIFTSDNIKSYDDKKHLIFDRMMQIREKKINKVEPYTNGLVEVLYSENEKNYVALINLSNATIHHKNQWGKLKESHFYSENSKIEKEETLQILPYKGRVYAIL